MEMNNNYPTIDIIVPIYNCQDYISETIESLIQQTYPNKRIILVNDGSTDLTSDLLNKYSKFEHITLIDLKKNVGESAAINVGWRNSKSRFVGIVSADDPQSINWLSELMRFILDNPGYVFYYPDVLVIDEHSNQVDSIQPHEYNEELLTKKFICLPSAGTIIDRSSLDCEFVPRLEGVVHPSDLIQWLRISKFGKGKKMPGLLGTWRKHQQSLSFFNTYERASQFRHGIELWAANENIVLDVTQRFYLLAHQLMILRDASLTKKLAFLGANTKLFGVLFHYSSFKYIVRYMTRGLRRTEC